MPAAPLPARAPTGPRLPFDAFRVSGRDDFGFTVTRVEVREIYRSSGYALIGYGRGLHSECMVPWAELFSTPEAAQAHIHDRLARLTYRTEVWQRHLPTAP